MRLFRLIGGVALTGVAAISFAAPSLVLSSHVGDHWDYTLSNAGAADGQFLYDINLSLGMDVQNISSPAGWDGFFTSGTGFIEWQSSDLPFDLAPDGTLGGFSFDAPGAVEQSGSYNTTFWDHNTDSPGDVFYDSTTIPVPAAASPEPATCLALGLGAAALLRRRRR